MHACENITLPQLLLRAVVSSNLDNQCSGWTVIYAVYEALCFPLLRTIIIIDLSVINIGLVIVSVVDSLSNINLLHVSFCCYV